MIRGNILKREGILTFLTFNVMMFSSFFQMKADDAYKIGGIYYRIIGDHEVEVASQRADEENVQPPEYVYNGNIIIPETVTIEGSEYRVTRIGRGAFCSSTGLESVTVPNTVNKIEIDAFLHCWGLRYVRLGSSVQTLGRPGSNSIDEVFLYCHHFRDIDVDESNPWYSSYDGILYDKEQKTLLFFPQAKEKFKFAPTVTSIMDRVFCLAASYETIIIPENVESIGERAFSVFKLQHDFVIGKGVKSIGKKAFDFNDWNTKFYYTKIINLNPVPLECDDLFNEKIYIESILYVPEESIEAYKSCYPWSEFRNIRSLEESGIEGIVNTEESPESVYTIQGIRVADPSNLQPGLYIINGKKTLIKNNTQHLEFIK